jgi:hypothetical protein
MLKENDADANKLPDSTGVDTMWYVKGDDFRFRIASELQSATRFSTRTKKNRIHADQLVNSWPMHVSKGMISTLFITIQRVTDGIDTITGRQDFDFDTKQVPNVIWVPYNRSLDPMNSRNRNPSALLDGNAPPAVELAIV